MKVVEKNDNNGKGTYKSLQEIYCNTVLETAEGNQVAICMRDDTIDWIREYLKRL